jgi:polysaccharide export outer membrane protein
MAISRPHITALFLAGLVLSSCTFMPRSGPSLREMKSAPNNGIAIVELDPSVTRRLLDRRSKDLFSDVFQSMPGLNELVEPGDIVEVAIWEAPPAVLFAPLLREDAQSSVAPSSMTSFPEQMVGIKGTIYIPFAGNILVAGKDVHDIEADITHKLIGKANAPQVLVRLVENNTAYVTVIGEVAKSTRMSLTPRGEHLLDALAAAGGPTKPTDKTTLQLTRVNTVRALPLDTVIRNPIQNIPLQAGDVVTVLYQPISFTALGATGKSDEINFESQGISLAQALARVGGVQDSRAAVNGVFIFRFESNLPADTGVSATVLADGTTPVIYHLDMRDPRAFFVAQNFPIENKDLLYVANAPAAELQKFLNLILSTVYPIQGAITLAK